MVSINPKSLDARILRAMGYINGTSVAFAKKFKDNNYNIVLGIYRQGNTSDHAVVYIRDKQITSFTTIHVWNGGSSGTGSTFWKASGYLAADQY